MSAAVSADNRVKPLPKEVYVRRRVAAAVALLLVVLLLWWLISSLTGSDDAENAAATEQAVTSTTPDMTSPNEPPNAKESESETTSAKESATSTSESASAEASAKNSCELGDLDVTAKPGATTFADGKQPNFFAEISNPTKKECVIDAGDSPLKFEVFTLGGYERVWADLDCNSSDVSGDITIPAGEKVNYELKAWSRTTSAPDQCDNRQPVDAGAYLLYAHLGDNVSEPATFNLS